MAPTESPKNRREREARERARQQAEFAAYRRASRRRGAVGIGVVVFVVLAVIGVVKAATSPKSSTSSTSTTSSPGRPTSTLGGNNKPAASLPSVSPGSALTAPAGCPPADGSAGRVTQFAAPPPDCLDPAVDYSAVLHTSRGPIKVDLEEKTSPAAVNNFVFLARYHYYDGLPFTAVKRGAYAEVADPVNAGGSPGPGYTLPGEGKKQNNILTSLLVALLPRSDGTFGGGLLIAMPGDQYTQIPQNALPIGVILSALIDPCKSDTEQRTVQQEINDTANTAGKPSDVITIDRVEIQETEVPLCPTGQGG